MSQSVFTPELYGVLARNLFVFSHRFQTSDLKSRSCLKRLMLLSFELFSIFSSERKPSQKLKISILQQEFKTSPFENSKIE